MTQPILLIDQVYAVEVPDDIGFRKPEYCFQPSLNDLLNENHACSELIISFERKTCGLPRTKISVNLPSAGTWEIICTSNDATEDQAKEIARELPVGQRWMNYSGDFPVWYHTAKESLRSLLLSKNLNPFKNYIILKKIA